LNPTGLKLREAAFDLKVSERYGIDRKINKRLNYISVRTDSLQSLVKFFLEAEIESSTNLWIFWFAPV